MALEADPAVRVIREYIFENDSSIQPAQPKATTTVLVVILPPPSPQCIIQYSRLSISQLLHTLSLWRASGVPSTSHVGPSPPLTEGDLRWLNTQVPSGLATTLVVRNGCILYRLPGILRAIITPGRVVLMLTEGGIDGTMLGAVKGILQGGGGNFMLKSLTQCFLTASVALIQRHGEVRAAQPPPHHTEDSGSTLAHIEALRAWNAVVEGEMTLLGALRSEAEELTRDEVRCLTLATTCGGSAVVVAAAVKKDLEEALDAHTSSVQALFTAYTLLRENGRAVEATLQHSLDEKQIQLLVMEVAVITLNTLIAAMVSYWGRGGWWGGGVWMCVKAPLSSHLPTPPSPLLPPPPSPPQRHIRLWSPLHLA